MEDDRGVGDKGRGCGGEVIDKGGAGEGKVILGRDWGREGGDEGGRGGKGGYIGGGLVN